MEKIGKVEEKLSELKELDSWDPMGEFWNSPANTIALDYKDPVAFHLGKSLPLGSKIGDVTICEHYAKRGKCADGKYCDRLHINPNDRERIIEIQSKINHTQNRVVLNVSYLSPQNYIIDGKLLICTITNFRDPNLFHVNIPYESLDCEGINDYNHIKFHIEHIPTKSGTTRQLKKITDLLQEMYGRNYRIDNVNEPILPTQVVACKTECGRFRRAIVMHSPDRLLNPLDEDYESLENTHYKLFLIDLGTEGWFEREAIYDIKANCLSEPPMAVACTTGLKPANGLKEWSREVIDYFKSLLLGDNKFLLCRFNREHVDVDGYIDGYEVELFDIKTRQNYCDKLIKEGYASRY